MKSFETKTTRFLASRSCAILLMVLGLFAAVAGYRPTAVDAGLNSGPVFASPSMWIADPAVRFGTGLFLTVGVLALMDALNRVFNLLRTPSLLFLGLFMVMQAATPALIGSAIGGVVLNVAVLGVLTVIYTTYLAPKLTRRVFLVFFVLSALLLCDYVYAVYIAMFLLSFSQMRCSGPRMLLSAAVGIIAPAWIVFGLGLATPGDVHWPWPETLLTSLDRGRLVTLLVTVGITVIGGFLLCAMNMVKIYSYNAKDRSFSGLLMMLTLGTAVAVLVDFRNCMAYMSLLNCLMAFQVGLFFRVNANRRAYIVVCGMLLCYAVIYFVNLWV